MSTYR